MYPSYPKMSTFLGAIDEGFEIFYSTSLSIKLYNIYILPHPSAIDINILYN